MGLSRRRFLALAALAASCRSRERRTEGTEPEVDVAIVGAGLAGLAAAHSMLAAGRSVTLLEARTRVGGRVHTLREPFAHGQHAEAGAIFVPRAHATTLRYVDRFGLDLGPAFDGGPEMGLFVHDRILRSGRLDDLPVELRDDERSLGLRGLMARYLLAGMAELGDLQGGVEGDVLRHLDSLSMADLLRERGASEGAVELLGVGYLSILGDGIEHTSALQILRDLKGGGLDSRRIVGGSSRLPEAMGESVQAILHPGAEVRAIEESSASVLVRFQAEGENRVLRARRAIVTLPTTVLRDIELPPGLTRAKRRALDELGSTSVVRTYLQCEQRFWRPFASLDIDRPALQLMDATGGQPGAAGILEGYASGEAARDLDPQDDGQRLDHLRAQALRVFPGAPVGDARGTSYSWDQDPYARGGYVWFRPGEMAAHYATLRAIEGRLHFAGEHTSAWSGWMQGALESGERAAREAEEALRG